MRRPNRSVGPVVLAWLVVLVVVFSVAGASLLSHRSALAIGSPPVRLADLAWSAPFLAFSVVGAMIVSRRPGNAVGWLMCAIGLSLSVGIVGDEYARYGLLSAPGAVPVPEAGLVFGIAILVAIPLVPLLILFFPDGRLPSPRWRIPVGIGVAAFAVMLLMELVDPHPGFWEGQVVANPLAAPGFHAVLDRVAPAVTVGMILLAAVAVVAPIARFRRSSGIERLQLRWLAAAVVLLPVAVLIAGGLRGLGVLGDDGVTFVTMVPAVAVPAAIAIAVTRYRLYDIDRIVSRTVSYALITAVLAAVYVGGVLVLGALVRGLAGEGGGDLVVAASTLLVAAAFGPVRRWVQSTVDRHFNRARFDAGAELERFAQRTRARVDLRPLDGDLRAVVTTSLHPDGVSLWLKPPREVRR